MTQWQFLPSESSLVRTSISEALGLSPQAASPLKHMRDSVTASFKEIEDVIKTQNGSETLISRDYWQLSRCRLGSFIVLVQGRRRLTEAYWPGLKLTPEGLRRFAAAINDVTSIVDNYFTTPQSRSEPMYPHSDLLAVCDGPDYMIEMATSTVGTG